MICEIPNDFFLPDGKNTQLSKVVNTWTFNRLTPNGNEGVGVKLNLEQAYRTRYYVIDKVSGDINAIHDESLELTEFKGCFIPFDLDNLEAKVCRLALGNKDKEDVAEPQNAPQICFTDPRTLNMEEYESMGFDENNYSLIPPVSQVTSQNMDPRPTSTPKPTEVQQLNISDQTHNRGKINRVNSFDTAQERVKADASKGGPFKSSGMRGHPQPSGSNQVESRRPQLSCTACGGRDHLRKDCREDVFCNKCRTRFHATEMC